MKRLAPGTIAGIHLSDTALPGYAQSLERKRGELEFDSASDTASEFPSDGCDVLTQTCPCYQPGCCILY